MARTPDEIGYAQSINDLQAGDILLFRPPRATGIVQRGIMFLQSLIGQAHGHYDTTHAAICVGVENGKAVIAHLTEHNNVMGYKKEPLEDMIQRDGGDRAFLVFRPQNAEIRQKVAAVAGDEKANKDIKWKINAAFGVFARVAILDPGRQTNTPKELAKESFCSKFVIQAVKIATAPLKSNLPLLDVVNYYPNLRSSSTPKALEAYLYTQACYDMIVCPGKTNPYELIKKEIAEQLTRLSAKPGAEAVKKYNHLTQEFARLTNIIDQTNKNPLQKSLALLAELSPALRANTGYGLREAESYRKVMSVARRIGVFERDIEIQAATISRSRR